jgi:hypothetical protein
MVQAWKDNDGLYHKYGPDKATPKKAGEYVTTGNFREVQLRIDLTALTEAETIVDDTVFIPAGMRIQEVVIDTITAATDGTAIDLGLIKTDRSTQVDYDGILAAFPIASMNAAGERAIIVDNSTYDGAYVGAKNVDFTSYITCSRTDSTSFGAGLINVIIRMYRP